MAIDIQMTTPLNGERQVDKATSIVFQITSDLALALTDSQTLDGTLFVRINGTEAVSRGEFQKLTNSFTEQIIEPTRIINLNDPIEFIVGEQVEILDGYSGPFINTVDAIDQQQVKFRNAVENLSNGYVNSISRGFEGSIVVNDTNNPTEAEITINPLSEFNIDSIVLITVEVSDIEGSRQSSVFTFRTRDTVPPQVVNLNSIITNSEFSFKLYDVLQNQINIDSISVFVDGSPAINLGTITSDYTGSIIQRNPSEYDVYFRPKSRYDNQQRLNLTIQSTDGYGNFGLLSQQITNITKFPNIETIDILPTEEAVVDPLNKQFTIKITTDTPVERRFINVSHIIKSASGDREYPSIIAGEFIEETGTLVSGREIIITLDGPREINYNQAVDIRVFFQALDDNQDPIGGSFFERKYSYSTVSTRLGPIIDNFLPSEEQIASPSSSISFRVISVVDKDPINRSTLNVAINNILAIDQGEFTNNYTGTISEVNNSNGNSVLTTIIPPTDFEVGSTATVVVDVEDQAGNLSQQTFTFPITNTAIPVVTANPSGGVYNQLLRVSLESDQPTQIYYTLDGSVPSAGALNTFVSTNPATDIPVFSQGITQVKALAVNAAGIQSEVLTEIYDVNQFPPIITITSPVNQSVQDITTVTVEYSIELERGFLSRVEFSLNGGPRIDMQNTLSNSSILVTGLVSGANRVEISATDNSGNVGFSSIEIIVNPSSIESFKLKFAPLECPEFTRRTATISQQFNDFIDTATVILIGYGKRTETLVDFGIGSGEDGRPFKFIAGQEPDGRHFQLNSFPVVKDSECLLLFRKGRQIQIAKRDYVIKESSGQIVLDHPIELGENLTVEYISESDINTPEVYTANQLDRLYAKHGTPSLENTLSLAAELAFENGAPRVVAIQPLPIEIDSTWSQTFARLEKENGYWITPVVSNQLLTYYPAIRAAAFNHSIKMSEVKYRNERVVSAGRIDLEQNSFNSNRLFYASPDLDLPITRIIQGESQLLNPTLLAACASGKHAGFGNTATPLTNKTISGFTMQSDKKSPKLDIDRIIRQGFMPIQARASGGLITRGRTSSLSGDPRLEEISVQRTVDYISKNTRRLVENSFVGSNIIAGLLTDIKTTAQQYLNTLENISSGTVTNVSVDSVDPRQINIAIDYTPLFPLNSLQISFNLVATI